MTMTLTAQAEVEVKDISTDAPEHVQSKEKPQNFAWFWQRKDDAKDKSDAKSSAQPANLAAPVAPSVDMPHIALILPLSGQYAVAAQAIREGFIGAYYLDPANEQTDVRIYDTNGDKDVVKAYTAAINAGANIVVGPLTKSGMETLLDSKRVDNKIIVISLNTLEGRNRLPQYLYPFALGPEDEAYTLAERAWNDGHREAAALIEKTTFGRRAGASFKKRFEQLGGTVHQMVYFDQNQTLDDPVDYLKQTYDFIFLMASPGQARQVPPLIQFYYNRYVPIYAMANLYEGTPNPGRDNDLNGVIFCDSPWIVNPAQRNSTLNAMATQLLTQPIAQERLFAFGVDAYKVSKNIRSFSANPQFSMSGATGRLYMDNSGFMVREPMCARFSAGEPRVL